MKHKTLTFMLAVLMSMTANVTSAFDYFEVDGIFYTITSSTDLTVAVFTYSDEYANNITIPESVCYSGNTYSVTGIDNYAFEECTGLISVTIPESVTSIGWYAFKGCTGLTSVEFNARRCTKCGGLGKPAFPSTIKTLTLGNEVEAIPDYAFSGCRSLASITIPESVTSIGSSAFSSCFFVYNMFINNSSLSSDYTWGATLCDEETKDGLLIKDEIAVGCRPWATSITIPQNVKSIIGAFSGCTGLTSIEIPDNVTTIGARAFYGCMNLNSISIGNSVTSIGEYAFQNCSVIKSLTIPKSTITIERGAFNACNSLKEVILQDGEDKLSLGYNSYSNDGRGKGLFYDCPLETLYLGRNLSYDYSENYNYSANYGYSPFYNIKRLTSVVIGNSVTEIGQYLLQDCNSLASVTIPDKVTKIGAWAFSGCSGITSVTIPESVTEIGGYAFSGCDKVEYLDINCSTFYDYFNHCQNLRKLIIGENVKEIGSSAFSWSQNLDDCSFASIESLLNIRFGDGYANPLCHAKTLNVGGKMVTELKIPESVTKINNYALYNCNSIKKVTGGKNVTSIGASAFYNNVKLSSIQIGSKVETIGNKAFNGCPLLNIYNYAEYPQNCGTDVFSVVKSNCKLFVSEDSKELYQVHKDWYEFNIMGMDDEMVNVKSVDKEHLTINNSIYDLSGRQVMKPTKGINIMNGKKNLVK